MTELDIASGPYLYDDPRFIYDEQCMFYDGGFSIVCLTNLRPRLPKKIGKGAGIAPAKKRFQKEECRTVIDIKIECLPNSVNEQGVKDAKSVVKRYHLDYGPIQVSLDKIKHNQNEINVHMQAVTSSINIPRVCITDKNIKMLPIKTIVSSSLSRIKFSKPIFKTETIKKK